MSVAIVAYGLGNLGSVVNMFKRIGVESRLVSDPAEILDSERLLLPGVGAFDTGMRMLDELGLVDPIRAFAATGRPLLGICLGMQLLLDGSEEGRSAGLGLIPGRSKRFVEVAGLRVPHMGWNHIESAREDALFAELPDDSRFYFVHSYHVVPEDERHALATTFYGGPFTSMVRDGNVMGAQFHPEKSHDFGKRILQNFAVS